MNPGGVMTDIPMAAQAALELQINECLRDQLNRLGLDDREQEMLTGEDFLRQVGENYEIYQFKGTDLLTITRSWVEETQSWDYDFKVEGVGEKKPSE